MDVAWPHHVRPDGRRWLVDLQLLVFRPLAPTRGCPSRVGFHQDLVPGQRSLPLLLIGVANLNRSAQGCDRRPNVAALSQM
jgi:hypothetical protein